MLKSIYSFYAEGFRGMRLGRTLWKIVLIKVSVLFLLANFILPDYLNRNFSTPEQRAAHVLDNLTVSPMTTPTHIHPEPSAEPGRGSGFFSNGNQSTH